MRWDYLIDPPPPLPDDYLNDAETDAGYQRKSELVICSCCKNNSADNFNNYEQIVLEDEDICF